MQPKTDKPRYVLYARKSSESEDRQIQSIDDQIKRLEQLAQDLNVDVGKIYTEAKSAKKPDNRLVFEELMQYIENGQAQGILCWQINRLSRNPIDSARIQWLLQQGILQSIQTIDREYKPEDNVLLFSVESGMANQFVLDLSKNVRRGMQSKVERGIYPHQAPAGYLNDVQNRQIVSDPDRFHILRRAWDFMLTGNYTAPQILQVLNGEWGYRSLKRKRSGDKPMAISGIYKLFTNLFYTGFFEWNGKQYKGIHKPMVTLVEYDRVQTVLGRKGKPRQKRHTFSYTGIMRCGMCGCMITAETKTKNIKSTGKIREYTYYHCTRKHRHLKCTQRSVTAINLEKQIERELDRITILAEFRDWALENLNRSNDKEIAERTQIHEGLSRAVLDTQAQLDNLTQMRYKNLITDAEYLKQRHALQREIAILKPKLRETEDRAEEWRKLTEKTFQFATYARSHFINGTAQTKKEILLTLGSNFILKDGKLSLQASKLFKPIAEGYPTLEQKYLRLELDEKPLNETQNAAKAALIPSWYTIVEDVRTEILKLGDKLRDFPNLKTPMLQTLPLVA